MKKLLNFRPLVFICLSLISGIIAFYFFATRNILLAVSTVIFFIIILSLFFILYSDRGSYKKYLTRILILVLSFLLGVGVLVQIKSYENANLDNHYFSVSGKVAEITTSDYGANAVIKDVYLDGYIKGETKYKIFLNVNGKCDLKIGDAVEFESFLVDKGLKFDGKFIGSYISDKIKYTASVIADDVTIKDNKKNVFETINNKISETLSSCLDEDVYPIAYALLTGNSTLVESGVMDKFRTAGVAHIFAVSGLHIGFLAIVLNFVLSKMKVNKYVRVLLLFVICLFYSGICGFSASSLRATIMTTVLLLSGALGERYDSLSSISLAAIIVLLISPVQLFCAGFSLSFGVVVGINLLSSPLSQLFKFLPQKLFTLLSVTLSAQIFSIPVSLYFFNSFSLIAVLCNLFLMPVIGVVFISLFILTLLSFIGLSNIFLFLPNIFLKVLKVVITSLDSELFIISGVNMGIFAVFYYGLFIVGSGVVNLKVRTRRIVAITFASVFICGSAVKSTLDFFSPKIFVTGSDTLSAVILTYKGENTLIVANSKYIYSPANIKRISGKEGIDKIDNLILTDRHVDMQVFATKINYVFDMENIYYGGERNSVAEELVKGSFGDVNLTNVNDEKAYGDKTKFAFSEDLKKITVYCGKRRILVCTEFNETTPKFLDVDGKYDAVICYNYEDAIFNNIPSEIQVCFLYSDKYQNGESDGYLPLKID